MVDITSLLQTAKTDAFLISQFYNVLYLTGFEPLSPHEREAYLLLINGKKIIITDGRYAGEKHSDDSELYILKPKERALEVVGRMCHGGNAKTLGCELDDLKWGEQIQLKKTGMELLPFARILSPYRSIKTDEELFAIKQACHIGDQVLKDITPYIHPEQSEKEIAWLLEKMVREGYGAQIAFDPIVAVDAHAANPHYNTKQGEGVIKDGSLLLIDFGVKSHNYSSDITRMVGVGGVSDEIKNTYAKLLEVQKKTVAYVDTATELKSIDAFCRNELQKNNLPNFSHSTGHGIGLEVHEAPRVNIISSDIKKVGQVFTIEPGIYIPDKWGMRIEDTITVSEEGVEVLTRFPKALVLV